MNQAAHSNLQMIRWTKLARAELDRRANTDLMADIVVTASNKIRLTDHSLRKHITEYEARQHPRGRLQAQ